MYNHPNHYIHVLRTSLFCFAGLLASGCQGEDSDKEGAASGDAGEVVFRTTPLSNDPISDACYKLTATSLDDSDPPVQTTLWEVDACAEAYGGVEGTLEYVGFCDSAQPTTKISLELLSFKDSNGQPADLNDYEDPCEGTENPCSTTVTCVPNEDVQVFLPITILETGDQGFVDVDVEIDSITCSAKLDCFAADEPGFVLEDDQGNALDTVVLGLSCQTEECSDNNLYMNNLAVACDTDDDGNFDDVVVPISPSSSGAVDLQSPSAPVERAAVYSGASADKLTNYTNVALGMTPGTANKCQLTTKATLSQVALNNNTTPANAVYPHIDWSVPLTNLAGDLICSEHALNATNSGVSTAFTGLDAGPEITFDHRISQTCEPIIDDASIDHKIVFVTSSTYTGNFGDLAAADTECQTLAEKAGLGGNYMAWLSDGTDSPNSRFIQATVPYKLRDGLTVATNYADLTNGTLSENIDVDERGHTPGDVNLVWTGSNVDGTGLSEHCSNWSDDTELVLGRAGHYADTNGHWTASDPVPCSSRARLYCFEQ